MKKLFATTLYLVGFALSNLVQPSAVLADSGCTPIYGGGVSCPPSVQILIDKTVRNPIDGMFYDNLTNRFNPNQEVKYRLDVQNTSDQTVTNVKVVDTLPKHLKFISGQGSWTYDTTSNTLSTTISELKAREVVRYELITNVVDTATLQAVMGSLTVDCIVNVAEVSVNDRSDDDSAQVCVEKSVLGTPALPTSGPKETAVLAMGAIGLLVVGRKLSKVTV